MSDREEKSFLGLTPIQWPYIIFTFKGDRDEEIFSSGWRCFVVAGVFSLVVATNFGGAVFSKEETQQHQVSGWQE